MNVLSQISAPPYSDVYFILTLCMRHVAGQINLSNIIIIIICFRYTCNGRQW